MSEKGIFFDEAKIYVRGGDGGNGCISFRREKYVPFGGPNGGNGGKGGDVYLVASAHLNTLVHFHRKSHFKARRGEHGRGKDQHGKTGDDLLVEVPAGTVVFEAHTGEVIADLTEDGQRALVARGGRGGRGNATFATATNQAPRIAEKGEPGEERWLRLELRLLADVGIVGMPNAGKSTLLAAVSAARPKIADYPFTTLIPNLGVVEVDRRTFVMADIPGLIEGAHQGLGLGDKFLRHIQRTRVLVHLLDGIAPDPLSDFEAINEELAEFDRSLAQKPQIVVLNKMDLPEVREKWPECSRALEERGYDALAISAVTGEGVQPLLRRVAALLDEHAEEPGALPEVKVFRPPPDESAFEIVREADYWRVKGIAVERRAAMTNWDLDEGILHFQRVLDAMGITEALEKAGVEPGDTVVIGEAVLEWQ